LFIKTKKHGRKVVYYLAHSTRVGGKVKQPSLYLGDTLALTGQEWIDKLASARGFQPTIRKVYPVIEAFIERRGLPRDTIKGLKDATSIDLRQRLPTSPLRVLGLQPGAKWADVKRAFRQKSLRCHPDQGGDPEEFKKLVAARDKLEAQLCTPTIAVPKS
jgi:hypothetical protein